MPSTLLLLIFFGLIQKHTGRSRRLFALGYPRRVPLIAAITIAVALGLTLVILAYWQIGNYVGADRSKTAAPIEITKTAFTLVAGIGGTVALVVAYRRQRDIEQGRYVDRFGAAAAQLGHPDVAIRIAGVYAMAGVADENSGHRRQQCIDVLCGYLRLPYSPPHGSNHLSEIVDKRIHENASREYFRGSITRRLKSAWSRLTTRKKKEEKQLPQDSYQARGLRLEAAEGRREREERFTYRQNDREVRNTILRVIALHIRRPSSYNAYSAVSWSKNDFDFTNAIFEDLDFRDLRFYGTATFDGAIFKGGHTWFDETTFDGDLVSFAGARFMAYGTSFLRTQFLAGITTFTAAEFSSEKTSFRGAHFAGASTWLNGIAFGGGEISFESVQFTCVEELEILRPTMTARKLSFVNAVVNCPGLIEKPKDGDLVSEQVFPADWPPALKKPMDLNVAD